MNANLKYRYVAESLDDDGAYVVATEPEYIHFPSDCSSDHNREFSSDWLLFWRRRCQYVGDQFKKDLISKRAEFLVRMAAI
jgi:hypothetical protein